MANSRTKGHNFERYLADLYRKLGFIYCKTSRAESKTLDNCKVDLYGIPFNVQAKSGYEKHLPNYRKLREESKQELLKNYPKTNEIHSFPFVLIHKTSGNDITVTMDIEHYIDLLRTKFNVPDSEDFSGEIENTN
jgi:hypothetical protein